MMLKYIAILTFLVVTFVVVVLSLPHSSDAVPTSSVQIAVVRGNLPVSPNDKPKSVVKPVSMATRVEPNSYYDSEERMIRSSLFQDKEISNRIAISCRSLSCDIFPIGDEQGSYPQAVALIIALNSGIKDLELKRIGMAIEKRRFLTPSNDRLIHVTLTRI